MEDLLQNVSTDSFELDDLQKKTYPNIGWICSVTSGSSLFSMWVQVLSQHRRLGIRDLLRVVSNPSKWATKTNRILFMIAASNRKHLLGVRRIMPGRGLGSRVSPTVPTVKNIFRLYGPPSPQLAPHNQKTMGKIDEMETALHQIQFCDILQNVGPPFSKL